MIQRHSRSDISLNSTQTKFFKFLVDRIQIKKINLYDLESLCEIPEFNICENVLDHIIKKQKLKFSKITNNFELHLQQIIIKYFAVSNKHFQYKLIINAINEYFNEVQDDILTYFIPLYHLEFQGRHFRINSFAQIRKISKFEHDYLINIKSNLPTQMAIKQINHVLEIKIKNTTNNAYHIRLMADEILNKLLIIRSGDLRRGGLYAIKKKHVGFGLIDFEPMYIFSQNSYAITQKNIKKIRSGLSTISKCYPSHDKTRDFEQKYGDYFNRLINRFNTAVKNKSENEKIVDLIFALEILLVSQPGEIRTRLSQRAGLFIGRDDKEQIMIWQYVKSLYDFRSKYVHMSKSTQIKIKNSEPITKKSATLQLETWVRRGIYQMVVLTQSTKYANLKIDQIHKKLDLAIFDNKLNLEFRNLSKKSHLFLKDI